MYIPDNTDETVYTPNGPGTWTGDSGQFDEHFDIKLESGGTVRLHYEDIYEKQNHVPGRFNA